MHTGLFAVAKSLADDPGGGLPERRVAISAAYYALFNKLAAYCANALVGPLSEGLPNSGWEEAYRNLSHGAVDRACRDCVGRDAGRFPRGVETFARRFSPAMRLRHRADYDPFFQPTRVETLAHVEAVEIAMSEIELVGLDDRRAFAAYLYFEVGRKNVRRGEQ